MLLAMLLALLTAPCYGQYKVIYRAQAIADIDSLSTTIKEVHPNPFTILPEAEFDRLIAGARENISDSLNTLEFWLRVAPVVRKIGDGHTYIEPPEPFFTGEGINNFFPFSVTVDSDGAKLRETSSGREVISINDVPVKTVIDTLLAYAFGESTAYRVVRINPLTTYLISVFYNSPEYTVELADGENTTKERLIALPHAATAVAQTEEHRQNYYYTIDKEKNTAVFTFNAFDEEEGEEPFGEFLERMFGEIERENIGNLIIDLRENGGGNSNYGDMLFQYISPTAFKQFGNTTVKYSRRIKDMFESYGWDFTEQIGSIKTYTTDKLHELDENPLRYAGKGNIYLLTSNYTFSSASKFAWTFNYFNMGTIVGEETGGRIVTFGDSMGYWLSYSGLYGSVSWKKFYGYGATDNEMHGVTPDIEVPSQETLNYVLGNLIK